jgi:methionine-rich copper-binding protein CopC
MWKNHSRSNRSMFAARANSFLLVCLCVFLHSICAGAQEPAKPTEPAQAQVQTQPRLIEILADHNSRYKVTGLDKPEITLTAGEEVRLRITAIKAKNRNRDGSVHGFTLIRAKGRTLVPGWDFLLMPGLQEFVVTAPLETGEYEVVCTVICGSGHEQMNMKVVVVGKGG